MSCMTEILKKKGDQEILPVARGGVYADIVIEGGGIYKGYEYLITFTDNGFRCGYVAIPEDHPAYEDKSDYPDYSIHGGITFFGEAHLSEPILGHSCTDKWIGFDAGHSGDLRDLEASLKYFPNLRTTRREHIEKMNRAMGMDHHHGYVAIRTKDYMEQECKFLIDQLINVKEAA